MNKRKEKITEIWDQYTVVLKIFMTIKSFFNNLKK